MMVNNEELAQRETRGRSMKFLRSLNIEDLHTLLSLNEMDRLGSLTQISVPARDRQKNVKSLRIVKRERARILTVLREKEISRK